MCSALHKLELNTLAFHSDNHLSQRFLVSELKERALINSYSQNNWYGNQVKRLPTKIPKRDVVRSEHTRVKIDSDPGPPGCDPQMVRRMTQSMCQNEAKSVVKILLFNNFPELT